MFFPSLYEDYFAKWPLIATTEDVEDAGGNSAVALAKVQKVEETVSDWIYLMISILIATIRKSTGGCTIVVGPSTA